MFCKIKQASHKKTNRASQVSQTVKNPSALYFPCKKKKKKKRTHLPMQETRVQPLGQEDPLEKGMATHSRILAWRIPQTEEPGGLQSMESQSQTRTEQQQQNASHLQPNGFFIYLNLHEDGPFSPHPLFLSPFLSLPHLYSLQIPSPRYHFNDCFQCVLAK